MARCKTKIEKDLNADVMSALQGLDPVRIENSVGEGTPDINYAYGWIEDKYVKAWPKRPGTVVALPKYTTEQRAWHVKRTNAGSDVYVVLRVGQNETFVFDGAVAARHLGVDWIGLDMIKYALWYSGTWDKQGFRAFFISRRRRRS